MEREWDEAPDHDVHTPTTYEEAEMSVEQLADLEYRREQRIAVNKLKQYE